MSKRVLGNKFQLLIIQLFLLVVYIFLKFYAKIN